MFLNVLCWLSTVMVNHHCSVLSLLIFAFKSFFSNGMWEMFQESCCKHISHIYILPAQRIFRFLFFFCIYIFMLICGSMWVRKCVWMNSTRLEKYMFWCPSFSTSIWELLHPLENESHNNSHCSPFLTAIIAFPFFPQTICNLLPAANGFSVWLLSLSLSRSLFLPPWMCVMSMWDFEGDSVWLLMCCAIAMLNLWRRECQATLLFNSFLLYIVPRSGLDVCERFRPQRPGWTEDRTWGPWAPGKTIPLTICLST